MTEMELFEKESEAERRRVLLGEDPKREAEQRAYAAAEAQRKARVAVEVAKALHVSEAEATALIQALDGYTTKDTTEAKISERWLTINAAALAGLTADELATVKLLGGHVYRHGDGSQQDYLDVQYVINEARDVMAVRTQVYRREMRQALLEAGIAPIHVAGVYDQEPWDTDAVRVVREWMAQEERYFLVLLGNTGVGKDAAASLAVVESEHYRSLAPRAANSMRDLRVGKLDSIVVNSPDTREASLYGEKGEAKYRALVKTPLLVIKDLGIEPLSDWMLIHFTKLINDRYEQMRRTIITSNIGTADIRKAYRDRIADRLHECARVVEVKGDTRAQRAKKSK